MSETKLDALLQKLSELNTTVKEHLVADDKSTLDVDMLSSEIKGIVDEQVKLKLEDVENNRPVRKGEWVGPEGFRTRSKGMVEKPGSKFDGCRVDDLLFTAHLLQQMHRVYPQGAKLPSDEMVKILDPFVAGSGDEFTYTGLASELWQDVFLASKVVGFLGGPIAMPTDPWEYPLRGDVVFRKATRGEAQSSQTPTTAESILTTTKLMAEVNWEYEMDEDSIIAVLPDLRQMLGRVGAESADAFVLNADATAASTGNINLDDATPPTDSYYLSDGQDGIRHYYLVDKTGQSADINTTLTDALVRAGIGRMGKYGVNPRDSALITDAKTYLLSLLGLTNVVTLDKYGAGATVLTGELASYQGHPIVVSESMLLAEDDGKVSTTAANNDEGQIAIPNRNFWKVGFKRQLLIEVDRDIQKQVFIMVASMRIAVGARDRSATHTAGIHGITY